MQLLPGENSRMPENELGPRSNIKSLQKKFFFKSLKDTKGVFFPCLFLFFVCLFLFSKLESRTVL